MFSSHAFHGNDSRFVEAAKRLREASALQLMVAPFSTVHEDEANLWKGREKELMELIKSIAIGHSFEPEYDVEKAQLCRAFESFLSSGASAFQVQEDDALEANVHDWDDYVYITVPGYHGDSDRIRTARQESAEALVGALPRWRATAKTFDEQVALEMEEHARQYLNAHIEHSARLAVGDIEAVVNSPLISQYVEWLLECLPQGNLEDGLGVLGSFFRSEHYNQIPYLWITARIYACVNDEIQKGAYTNREKAIDRLRGLHSDIKHAATYAPYCDAIFMEKKMTVYLSDPRINLEGRYGVKLYSSETLDEFINWINEVINGMSDTHREALFEIFPSPKQ